LEELYKVSKRIMQIEEFHSEYERGVKQELFAHLVLITMNRLFANEADAALNEEDRAVHGAQQSEAGPRKQANFKNCVHVVGRNIEDLLFDPGRTPDIPAATYAAIPRRYQATRPGRHYQRRSLRPPTKWQPGGKKTPAGKRKVASTSSTESEKAAKAPKASSVPPAEA
jgi:hypothetical protein